MAGQITVTPEGIKVPQASEIKIALQNIFQSSFGSDLSLDDSTPQGTLINGLTEEKLLDNAEILYLLNQLNPNTNSGIFQDAIGALFGMERKPATHSVVNCECVGLAGTVLNGKASGNPAMVQSTNGDLFECIAGGTIPAGGTITLQFEAVEAGPIPVSSNTLTTIYNMVSGWDTVNNSNAGTTGTEEESRADFEARRKESLALNATGSIGSVYSHVYNVSGVTDVFCYENPTGSSVTYRGITLSPHSAYICQNGASIINGTAGSGSLAEAIYNSLSAGCNTNGSNTCTYTDTITGVQYSYSYYNSTNTKIYIQVNIAYSISDELKQQVKEAFLKEFNGQSIVNNKKISIGDDVYASRFYDVVRTLNDNDIVLKSIKVSTNGSSWQDVLTFNMNILPVLDIESSSPSYVVFNVG